MNRVSRGSVGVALVAGITACVDEPSPRERGAAAPIIGGAPTSRSAYLATGALLADIAGEQRLLCTGTLVAPDAVLTAAHCVDPELIGDAVPSFTLELDVSVGVPAASLYTGAKVLPHPDFDPAAGGFELGMPHDVGLLLLADPVPVGTLARLPRASDPTPAVGDRVELCGYGYGSRGPLGLKRDGTTVIADVAPWELLLSGAEIVNPCHGDSGGPVFGALDGGGEVVTGVMSRGVAVDDCSSGGIVTRVDPYRAWIHGVADIPCGSGLSPDCPSPDAGTIEPDGGIGASDGAPAGCGCSTGSEELPGSWLLILGLATWIRVRRRQPTGSRGRLLAQRPRIPAETLACAG